MKPGDYFVVDSHQRKSALNAGSELFKAGVIEFRISTRACSEGFMVIACR